MRLGRRHAVALPVLVPMSLALAGCGAAPAADPKEVTMEPTMSGPTRHSYGEDPNQWLDLYPAVGASRGVVVIIHGGFWRAEYDASLGTPLAEDLSGRGWTAINVEYRRVGNGGGNPQTFADVSAAVELLGTLDLDLTRVVTLGHSAGGHLAAWLPARGRAGAPAGQPDTVAITHVISQAGVLDLDGGAQLGNGAARALMGGPPPYDVASPLHNLPLGVPLWAIHAPDDEIVPFEQSERYVAAATKAGDRATLVEVTGGHFDVINVASEAWAKILAVFDEIG